MECEALKVVVQAPELAVEDLAALEDGDFTHPAYRSLWEAVARAGGVGGAGADWVARVRDHCTDEVTRSLATELAVEPLPVTSPNQQYAQEYVARLRELTAARRIKQVKARLQRMNPVEETTAYNRLFGELVALEQHRRALRERAIGAGF